MDTMTPGTDRSEPPRLRKWEWTRAARKQPKEALSTLARHTLQTLAEYADADGSNCRPSYQALADDMALSRSRAGEGIKELVERGWVERRAITVHGRRATLFVPLIPASAGVASSGPPDDAPHVETGASSGPPDGTCPAHRTQPDQDQTKNQEEGAVLLERDDLEESLWRFLLLQQTAGLGLPKGEASDEAACLMLTAARALRCPDEALSKHRPAWRQLHGRVVEVLAAGVDPARLVEGISAEAPPDEVRRWPGFLRGRLEDAPVVTRQVATA